MRIPLRIVALALVLALAGCGGSPPSPDAMNRSYEAALERTAAAAAVLEQGEPQRAAFRRLEEFFATPADAIPAKAAEVYAPTAWLYDNLAIVEGAPAIGRYFATTARRVRSMKVEVLDVVHEGPDYYARWRMTIDSPKLADRPLVSYGMTQFRFDAQARVLVHRDFWDAGTGLYEHLPVIGSLARRIRAGAAGEAQ